MTLRYARRRMNRVSGWLRAAAPVWLPRLAPPGILAAALAGLWWLAGGLVLASLAATWRAWRADRAAIARPAAGAEDALARAQAAGSDGVCILLRLTDPGRGGPPPAAVVADRAARISGILRAGDLMERRDSADIAIVLAPGTTPDLEDLVQVAARVQGAATAPGQDAGTDPGAARLSAVLGCCRGADLAAIGAAGDRHARPVTPAAIVAAAADALADALVEGPGTIRVYTPGVHQRQTRRAALRADAVTALDAGRDSACASGGFTAWFQPQLCTDTGRVSGVEALARWDHPRHGMVSPAEFLPVLEAAGLLDRLGQHMLDQSLQAVAAWDAAGIDVPSVGVNLAAADLRDPRLAQRVAWMLDRYDLHGDRLSVEVLESVVAEGGMGASDSPVLRNVGALADLGCRIDLDDFGTGHASITSLHRLPVTRVKIDRSFVTGVDHGSDRQRMMMTILSMCEHLGLATLAEGVETPGEHAMLAQLGCNHVQGFGIARPMPFDACSDWLAARGAGHGDILPPARRRP